MMTDIETMRARQALRILTILNDCCPDEMYLSRDDDGRWHVSVVSEQTSQAEGDTVQDALAQVATVLSLEWDMSAEADEPIPYTLWEEHPGEPPGEIAHGKGFV